MSVRAFLDANILVYAVSRAPLEAQKKERALILIATENFGLSAQIFQEFYVTVTRKWKQPISPSEALKFIDSLAGVPFVSTDLPLIHQASKLSQRFQISYWDGSMLAAAERLSASIVYTEDLNHLQRYGALQVINPFRD